jgi:Na+-transporting NADH:ubiquinone oxidoreductase subunit NqrD
MKNQYELSAGSFSAVFHLFWGADAPLSTLTGAGLMIVATSRLAFAISAAGALVWVYALAALILSFAKPILPKRGLPVLHLFLVSFLGSLYMLIFNCINPYLGMETTFLLLLCPLCCAGSGICRRIEGLAPQESIFKAFLEALVLAVLLVALALIREPLGFGSLTLPGGPQGLVALFAPGSPGSPGESLYFPVRIIAASSGGLLLLGYILILFRRFKYRFVQEDAP